MDKPEHEKITLKDRFAEILGLILFAGWVIFLILHKILHAI
jgi:hypothetical protein